jgi:hypothetical protein
MITGISPLLSENLDWEVQNCNFTLAWKKCSSNRGPGVISHGLGLNFKRELWKKDTFNVECKV